LKQFLSVLFVLAFACSKEQKEPGPGTGGTGMGAGTGGAGSGAVGGALGGSGGSMSGTGGTGGGKAGTGGGAGSAGGGNGGNAGGGNAGASGSSGVGGASGGAAGSSTGGAGMAGSSGAGGAGMAGSSGAGGGGAGVSGVPFVYVGGTDGSITIYRLDRAAKTLTLDDTVNAGNYPSFLAVNPARTMLYAVLEGTTSVAAFAIDQATGGLTKRGSDQQAGGGAPTHISVDKTGDWVMIANYNGGSVRVFPVMDDGSLGAPSDTKMPGTNPHLIVTDAANAFAFVPCKGSDLVAQYVFNAQTGTLTPNGTPSVSTAGGAGPRHFAFHPNGQYAYLINELDDTMTAFAYDATTGRLTTIHSLSTLPGGMSSGSNSTAEVAVHPSGRFLYGSNRGDNSIVVYTLDQSTGRMTLAGHHPSGGQTPRHFSLDDTGTLLFAANRDTNNVVVFSVNPDTGRLTEESEVTNVQQPEFAGLVTIPGP
jgi:6-phosphogluconolactonase